MIQRNIDQESELEKVKVVDNKNTKRMRLSRKKLDSEAYQ